MRSLLAFLLTGAAHAGTSQEADLEVQRALLATLSTQRLTPPGLTPNDVEHLTLLAALNEGRVATTFAGLTLTRALADAGVSPHEVDVAWVVEHVSHDALRADAAAAIGVYGECSLARAAWSVAAAQCDADGREGRACRAAREGRARLSPTMEVRTARVVLEVAVLTGAPEQVCGTSQFQRAQDLRAAHERAAREVLSELRTGECRGAE